MNTARVPVTTTGGAEPVFARYFENCRAQLADARPVRAFGRLVRVTGLVMEATGLKLPLGAACLVSQDGDGTGASGTSVEAQVVGFAADRLFLMPTDPVFGLTPGAVVTPLELVNSPPRVDRTRIDRRSAPAGADERALRLPVGDALLGRVVDGAGRPLDGAGPLGEVLMRSIHGRPLNPIERVSIDAPLDVGVRAINGLLTVGRGQRLGLFAGSGVGKSVLLGMMARYTAADVIVVGLIGERGREVKEFVEEILGAGRSRAVVVAAPADTSPLLRMQGAAYATTIAEHFRDKGRQVLLIMDSLTRYAMAAREIALAIGEPPATKGYPPSVFARLPQLVERGGTGGTRGGSITAFYTVLAEGDDQQDPIADAARAILDGHFVLSRSLAEQGHYPAIDIEQSISRVMHAVAPREQLAAARRFKQLFARWQRNRDLIAVGAYSAGADPLLDEAIARYPRLEAFLQQDMTDKVTMDQTRIELMTALGS